MLRVIYTFLLILVSPIFLYGLFKKKPGKPSVGHRWKEHFGQTPAITSTKPIVWFHAVSVGEVIAASPLIRRYAQRFPHKSIVITTTTPTGAKQAEQLSDIATHRYMPLDFPFAIRGFIKTVKPRELIIVETELWPNTLELVSRAGIPITVINARLSERSFLRYRKVQPLFTMMTKNLDKILCQFQDDAERFIRLGISEERVQVTGSVKFDITLDSKKVAEGQQLRHLIGSDRPVWIAASTHDGESEQIIEVHQLIKKTLPEALLILVPRHPETFDKCYKYTQKLNVDTIKRTDLPTFIPDNVSIILGDTVGDMFTYLAASDVCFMGGSLLGSKVGGHNLIEPAAIGLPILVGPSYFNFNEITEKLSHAGACQIVQDTSSLLDALIPLLNSPEESRKHGNIGRIFVEINRGALEKTLENLD
ncbi:lipid IV(A) 3-deoxy-D-manno-octulosonic acid transferase [Vibrio mediterranei]|uniref:lipid IV(A) 3-deoxy-D-manno-octulosonic acid transferase n=1 Tax=Vibrio mediterranei TaxID=689 RepID=UPI00148B4BBE|nr:lipid IV(A) 3-deoxy-D-manno-octulosonic acid transferase [Vibrio mediterranei]NOI24432.1 3-deoxy-D-manno-octulosonic acid transferase [Vibrio mediterranei]